MTLRQLEVFLAIVRARSYRQAAEALHASQPALSQHIRELEGELGVRLFDRLTRGVILTEAGRLLEERAKRVFATLTDVRDVLGELQGLKRGSLLVGASTTPGIYVLPAIIGAFRRRHPGIDLQLRIANSRAIEDAIRAHDVDLGVVGGHGLAPGEECLAAGLADELVLIVSPRHRWAGRREVVPAELTDEPLLVREEGSATRRVTERALDQAGIRRRVSMELGHTEAIKQAVMAGLGVAFVSVHAVRGEVADRRLAAVRLRRLRIRRHFHVIHSEARTMSAGARALVTLLSTPRLSR
ncbi:MAG TPA: LysR family transcriptional regulator [Methylomirabilota bacterium]|jgi:LysR family transcriptional regulator, transcriptional activator of the cysJI operon|nr:LysR family transcriptional regulator [Methylomirabilota bacterium]